MILGITGGTGCGKTTLLDTVRECGGLALDCDRIYYRLLDSDEELRSALMQAFPDCFQDGKLQRKMLGARVFSNPMELAQLNEITHGAVRREVLRKLSGIPEFAAIDAIALFESGLADLCDVTVGVIASRENRLNRLAKRDGISPSYALSRMDSQHPDDWFREKCDYVLENNGTYEEFRSICRKFLKQKILNGGSINEY